MPFDMLHDSALLAATFAERYKRPPAWFEIVETTSLADLVWGMGRRLGMNPPSMELGRLTAAAWERMAPQARDRGAYRGDTEPISSAARRLGAPTDGVVYWWHGGETAAHLRMRDIIEFETILWQDDSWLFDEAGGWILAGLHDWPVYWLRLQSDQRRSS